MTDARPLADYTDPELSAETVRRVDAGTASEILTRPLESTYVAHLIGTPPTDARPIADFTDAELVADLVRRITPARPADVQAHRDTSPA